MSFPPPKKLVLGGEGGWWGHSGTPWGWGWGGNLATKPKVVGGFGLGKLEHIAPHQKKGFWGVRGGWGGTFWGAFLHTFGAIF